MLSVNLSGDWCLSSCAGKYSGKCVVEEEQCEDLTLFLKLLSHLTAKDYLSFVPVEEGEGTVEPVDVVVTGINTVLPLMSEETLKVWYH